MQSSDEAEYFKSPGAIQLRGIIVQSCLGADDVNDVSTILFTNSLLNIFVIPAIIVPLDHTPHCSVIIYVSAFLYEV